MKCTCWESAAVLPAWAASSLRADIRIIVQPAAYQPNAQNNPGSYAAAAAAYDAFV